MLLRTILLSLIILTTVTFSQETKKYTYPRDTTYTLKIAYTKYKKYYPQIKAIEYDKIKGHMQKSVAYDTASDRPLMLDIFSTASEKGPVRPAVILVHGGGWSSGNRNLMYPLANYLAQQGYVAIAIEYRLSPEAQYPAAVKDIKKAVSWVFKHSPMYNINSSKIAILGCSAGAQLAALVGLSYDKEQNNDSSQKVINAIINIDGIMDFSDPRAREHEDDPERGITPAGRWFGGGYAKKTALWKEASPIYYVDKDAVPILFINSSQPRFHVGRDEAMAILDKYSIYSEVHTFDDAPHSFWLFDPWFKRTAQYCDTFLKQLLNGKSQ